MVFILGLLAFSTGIVLIALSGLSKTGLVPYKQVLVRYTAQNFTDAVVVGPFLGAKGGVEISSCECQNGQTLFHVRDSEDLLVYSSPTFPPPSYDIEFDIPVPGYYTVIFNFVISNDAYVEVYEYRSEIGMFYPYEELYEIGLLVAIVGIAIGAIGMFMPSKAEESA